MMMRPDKPCGWVVDVPNDEDCAPCSALERLSPRQRTQAVEMATFLLWTWTGRRFGLCETVVRPCRVECEAAFSTFWGPNPPGGLMPSQGFRPALIGGEWYNVGCGCAGACQCGPDRATSVELPGPVAEISSIMVDGVALPDTSWILHDGILHRTDGGIWPWCNNPVGDVTDPESGAWEVTYLRGYPVPPGGEIQAYRLACEIAKSMCGDNDCALPSRISSISRQGVSVAILDNYDNLKDGLTGIWEIDAWITANRYKATPPPQIYSPDIEPGRGAGTFLGIGFGRTR